MWNDRCAGLDDFKKLQDSANQNKRKEKKIGKTKEAQIAYQELAQKKNVKTSAVEMNAPPLSARQKKKSRAAKEAEEEDDLTDEELDVHL